MLFWPNYWSKPLWNIYTPITVQAALASPQFSQPCPQLCRYLSHPPPPLPLYPELWEPGPLFKVHSTNDNRVLLLGRHVLGTGGLEFGIQTTDESMDQWTNKHRSIAQSQSGDGETLDICVSPHTLIHSHPAYTELLLVLERTALFLSPACAQAAFWALVPLTSLCVFYYLDQQTRQMGLPLSATLCVSPFNWAPSEQGLSFHFVFPALLKTLDQIYNM